MRIAPCKAFDEQVSDQEQPCDCSVRYLFLSCAVSSEILRWIAVERMFAQPGLADYLVGVGQEDKGSLGTAQYSADVVSCYASHLKASLDREGGQDQYKRIGNSPDERDPSRYPKATGIIDRAEAVMMLLLAVQSSKCEAISYWWTMNIQ